MNTKPAHRVLIVDDEPNNLQILGRFLREGGIDVSLAMGARQALDSLAYRVPDLFLLDVMMPETNGFELARILKHRPETKNVPIIFISALTDEESMLKAFDLGGEDYITKPFKSREVLSRVFAHLELKAYRDELEERVRRAVFQLETINMTLVSVLENANYYRDDETGLHIQRVTEYSRILIEVLDLPDESKREIVQYASLHDIGKVGIPDAILRKPARLDPDEMETMRQHCRIGHSILDREGIPQVAKNITLCHHEKWNGSGYPDGLAGEMIPYEARLVALADVYDALRSKRVYKPPFPRDQAEDIIRGERGGHFDPRLVDFFFARADDLDLVSRELRDKEK